MIGWQDLQLTPLDLYLSLIKDKKAILLANLSVTYTDLSWKMYISMTYGLSHVYTWYMVLILVPHVHVVYLSSLSHSVVCPPMALTSYQGPHITNSGKGHGHISVCARSAWGLDLGTRIAFIHYQLLHSNLARAFLNSAHMHAPHWWWLSVVDWWLHTVNLMHAI